MDSTCTCHLNRLTHHYGLHFTGFVIQVSLHVARRGCGASSLGFGSAPKSARGRPHGASIQVYLNKGLQYTIFYICRMLGFGRCVSRGGVETESAPPGPEPRRALFEVYTNKGLLCMLICMCCVLGFGRSRATAPPERPRARARARAARGRATPTPTPTNAHAAASARAAAPCWPAEAEGEPAWPTGGPYAHPRLKRALLRPARRRGGGHHRARHAGAGGGVSRCDVRTIHDGTVVWV